jgi:hypothetical protein
VLANHANRSVADLRRKSVRCLAHNAGSFSHSGASGKLGTLQTKLLYLILNRSEKEWKMPPHEWPMAKAQFAVIFD